MCLDNVDAVCEGMWVAGRWRGRPLILPLEVSQPEKPGTYGMTV